jgi:hypothetical protein
LAPIEEGKEATRALHDRIMRQKSGHVRWSKVVEPGRIMRDSLQGK